MLSKPNRLKKSNLFDKVYKQGIHLKGNFGKLIFLSADLLDNSKQLTPPRIGIVVSGKLGKATWRGKAKRQIRNIFRQNLNEIPQNLLITYILWDNSFSFEQLKKEIESLIAKIRV